MGSLWPRKSQISFQSQHTHNTEPTFISINCHPCSDSQPKGLAPQGCIIVTWVISVQSLSRVWLFVALWTAARQASLSMTNSWSLLKLMSIESVILLNQLILCCLPLLPPSIFPSIKVFYTESVLCIWWLKYWSFSFSISPFNENSGLISFSIDWLNLPAVQGTIKCLLQHHSPKTSILQCLAFQNNLQILKNF